MDPAIGAPTSRPSTKARVTSWICALVSRQKNVFAWSPSVAVTPCATKNSTADMNSRRNDRFLNTSPTSASRFRIRLRVLTGAACWRLRVTKTARMETRPVATIAAARHMAYGA